MVASVRSAGVVRPNTITAAVVLAVLVNTVLSVIFFFLPGADDIPVAAAAVGTAMSALALISAWGLWNGARWGAIGTLVLKGLNALTSIPGLFAWPSTQVAIGIAVGLVLTILIVALTLLPASRAFWGRAGATASRGGTA